MHRTRPGRRTPRKLAGGRAPVKVTAYAVVGKADNRAEWLKKRRSMLTASDVAIVLGIVHSKAYFATPFHLWLDKQGVLPESESGEASEMGTSMEDFNAALFAQKTGRKVECAQVLLRSRWYPWLGTTLDYWQELKGGRRGPLELKSTARKHNWPEHPDDISNPRVQFLGEPHLKWQAQLQTQLLVTGNEFGSLSAVIGQPTFHHRWQDFTPHAAFQALILRETRRFWHFVESKTPPPVDAFDASAARHFVRAHAEGPELRLSDAALEWDYELDRARAEERDARMRIDHYEAQFLVAMGGARSAELPNGAVYDIQRTPVASYVVKDQVRIQLKKRKHK